MLRRNCLLKHVTEGKRERRIEVSGIRGRRYKQLLGDLKDRGNAGHRMRKYEIVHCEKLALKEAMNLS
jgi:hypothetical protein